MTKKKITVIWEVCKDTGGHMFHLQMVHDLCFPSKAAALEAFSTQFKPKQSQSLCSQLKHKNSISSLGEGCDLWSGRGSQDMTYTQPTDPIQTAAIHVEAAPQRSACYSRGHTAPLECWRNTTEPH